ncbi:Poly-gamma-glutamate hydrolase family protein [Desulfonema limicola]|uniref:Poly-gamma-glutamate hydrolase family protein n=1 Tax=Desulfonema limicola TaxID=45656 RepID=A0A975GG49_9BACT|nr:poly-gamma-glutamate hydrolase family protein [Desulfonema limicola]QTA79920.1 Poly-gamma-glutamate hydrolase family protein [Desulfonema limicola]
MTDKYKNFDELKQNEVENKDYKILYREVNSKFAIIAPHGGGIEPGTIDIADITAGCDYTFYGFKGLKKKQNKILHITSRAFDEPSGLKASQNAIITISIHGSKYKKEIVHIGGKNHDLKEKIMYSLKSSGFYSVISDIPGLKGIKPENICNQCRSKKGVQLEISRGLREKMFDNLDHRLLRNKTPVFYKFVNALRQALMFEKLHQNCLD